MSAASEPRRSGAQTRELILDAAERLFAARGYRGTSLEEIGREAGLSRGTPGYFFRSKHGLYGEVLARIFARAQRALAPVYVRVRTADADVETTLTAVVREHLDLLAREPSFVRLIQWEALDNDARIIAEIGLLTNPLVDLIRELSRGNGTAGLDRDEAIGLLMSVAALCWFPLAYADSLGPIVGRDPRGAPALAAQTQSIVGFVVSRLDELAAPSS